MKRKVNWVALLLLSVIAFALLVGQAVTTLAGFVALVAAALVVGLYVGRRVFLRRDRAMH